MEQLVRDADPALDADFPALDSLQAHAIRRAALERGQAPRRRSRRLLVAIAAFLVLSATAAAAIVIATREPTAPQGVACYEFADLDSRAVVLPPSAGADASICTRLWQDGTFATTGSAPPLTACVNLEGALVVVPGDAGQCASLGLAQATNVRSLDPLIELRDRLLALTPPGGCTPMADTVTGAEAILTELGLVEQGWTVVAGPVADDRPCASWSIDADAASVFVVGVPEAPGS